MTRTVLSALAVLIAATLAAPPAHAGKVIVLSINGDRNGELEDGLSAIVEDRHDLVTSGEAERAARKAGLDDLDGPALGKLARRLGADAVVEGQVAREDEGFTLVVRIRGQNGKTAKKITLAMTRSKLSGKARKRLGVGVLDGIDQVLGIASEDEELDEEASKKQRVRKAKQSRKKARKAARELAEDEDRPDPELGEPELDDDDDDERGEDRVAARDEDGDEDLESALGVDKDDGDGAARRPRTRPAAIVALGPSATMRTLSFVSRTFDQAPLGYKSSMVPGARIAGELYPLALMGDGPAAGLGVGFEYDQTIGMVTRSSDAPEVSLPTRQNHWGADVRYQLRFGKKATAPSATASFGYGKRAFVVDRGQLPADAELDMPDVDYAFYAPGLAFRVPVGDRLALHAGGKAMLIRSAGPIQGTDSYGGAKITGFEGGGGFQVKVARSVVASLEGTFTQIGYAFVGNGEESNNRDLDPASKDVGGASDRYLGIAGGIGIVY